jgi:phage shock protein PspC (stress-responsive transcriptional regulator)
MKQVININFQGRVVPIEVSAYDILKNYTESLNRHFAAEEGKEEIINDIESRIGELFQERIKNGATCITDDDVNAIISSMGRPEDLETEDQAFSGNQQKQEDTFNAYQQSSNTDAGGRKRLFRDENDKVIGGVCSGVANYFGIDVVVVRILFVIAAISFGIGLLPYIILWIAVPSSATKVIGSPRKKLYRDIEDKYIGGVCSGLAHYFGINVWIPRVLFLLPLLTLFSRNNWGNWNDFGFHFFNFSPGALFIYIILWLVIPEAKTTAEKLEMKGEKVDMNSIKNSVMEEMKGVQVRAQKFGKEAGSFAAEKGKQFGAEAGSVAKRGSRSFGDIVIFLIKLLGYFILGSICLSLIVALFVFGIASIGIFPLKDYLLTEGWQNALAWGTLLFFIIAPMIGVIAWIIRKLAKIRTGSRMLRLSFGAMWIAGLICFILLCTSVGKDFRTSSNINEQEIGLTNPGIKSLEITSMSPGQRYTRNRFFSMNPYDGTDEDTAFVRNVAIHIIKSPNDSFRVTMIKLACGRTKRYADTLGAMINFNARQQDSLLIIDKAIAINKTDKFRNQRVILTVYVPIGKQIKVHDNVGWSHDVKFNGPWGTDWADIEFENLENGWDEGRWYTMTKDGLVGPDGKPSDSYKRDRVRIDGNGIDVNDGNGRVRINKNGITIDDKNEEGNNDDSENGSYRYDNNSKPTAIDSLKLKLKAEELRTKDSLKKVKDNIEKQLEKLENNTGGGTASTGFRTPLPALMMVLN